MPICEQSTADEKGLHMARSETQAVLETMQACLLRMQEALQELSVALQPEELERDHATVATKEIVFLDADDEECQPIANGFQQEQENGFANHVDLQSSARASEAPATITEDIRPETEHRRAAVQFPSATDGPEVQGELLENVETKNSQTGIPQVALKHASEEELGLKRKSSGMDDDFEKADIMERIHINAVLEGVSFLDSGSSFLSKYTPAVERCLRWWASIEEPKRDGRIHHFINSSTFETMCMGAILFNSALVALHEDWQMRNIGSDTPPSSLEVLESCCVVFFSMELLLRLWNHQAYFFVNKDMCWNIFDAILVAISLVDFIMHSLFSAKQTSNVVFMRIFRLLKLARIFRSLRSFRFFKELALLLESFQKSLYSLFWAFVMLAFVLYILSLIFMQLFFEYLSTGDVDTDTRGFLEERFGGLPSTLLSLYMCVTGGDGWVLYIDVIQDAGGIVYSMLFLFYTFFFLFALFNIVTASLVEKALVSSKPDRTELILTQRRKFKEQKDQFLEICEAMDINKDGNITWAEFQEWMTNPVLLAYMAYLGLEVHDVELFFKTVGAKKTFSGGSHREGSVTIEHFIEGCMNMKGSATALDMQRQLFEMEIMHQDVRNCQEMLSTSMTELAELIQRGNQSPTKIRWIGSMQSSAFGALSSAKSPKYVKGPECTSQPSAGMQTQNSNSISESSVLLGNGTRSLVESL